MQDDTLRESELAPNVFFSSLLFEKKNNKLIFIAERKNSDKQIFFKNGNKIFPEISQNAFFKKRKMSHCHLGSFTP